MGRKGRRGRSKKKQPRAASAAAVVLDPSPAPLPSVAAPAAAEPTAPPVEAMAPVEPIDEADEASVPPVGDLDVRFFAESSSEAWLAHELELRDPQFLRKMTANVARRRAHLARYVVGVVGVAVVLCLAALIKSAVPIGTGDARPRAAAQMAMPAAVTLPLALPTAVPVEPAPAGRVDGGG